MEKVFRRYNKIFEKIWLSINMTSRNIKSCDPDKEEEAGALLLVKPGITDLTESKNQIIEQIENWEKVQVVKPNNYFQNAAVDRILRVLTYKYLDCDLNLVHSNNNYLHDTASTFCLEEQEIETLNLQEFSDALIVPFEVEVTRTFLPVLQHPQIITVSSNHSCGKAWKCIRNLFTLKTCRQT